MIKGKIFGALVWFFVLVFLLVLIALPVEIKETEYFYLIVAPILVFFISFYYLVWKIYSNKEGFFLQNFIGVILLGLLIFFARKYGIYFYSLLLMPLIATALTMQIVPSILMVVLLCSFFALETFLHPPAPFWGNWHFILIIATTIFCWLLALELRHQIEKKKETEAKVKEMEEIERLSREFVTLTSHQLFTPLSIIRGFVSLLDSEDLGRLNQKQKEAVAQIYESTLRMIHLVGELLIISRIQQGKLPFDFKNTEISSLIKEVVNSFNQRLKEKNLILQMALPKEKIYLSIDPQKTISVLENLIDNAIKYTEKGWIKVGLEKRDSQVIISITDTGIGIPAHYKERIFQPFFRGKNILELDKKGCGLGLYIAKLFIEKQGGKIWAESQEGKGSKFFIALSIKPINKGKESK